MQSSSITLVYIRVQKQKACRGQAVSERKAGGELRSSVPHTENSCYTLLGNVCCEVNGAQDSLAFFFFLKQKWENQNCSVIIIINILIIITYYIDDTKHIYKPNLASTNSHYKYWNIHSCDVLLGTLKIKTFLGLDS